VGWALAAVALVLAACSDDAKSAEPTSTTTTTTKPIPDVGFLPPGTPLAQGLVVPRGSRLVGRTFPRHEGSMAAPAGSTSALLDVDHDPLAVWDDLADQANRIGVPMPHSGICVWVDRRSGAKLPVTSSPPSGAALICSVGAGGRGLYVLARLWRGSEAGELAIIVSGAISSRTGSSPAFDPGPAPSTADDGLPTVQPPPRPDVGDEFGRVSNALESGYRMRIPEGARLIGGGIARSLEDFAAVLAVRDAHEVIEALGHQIDPTGPKVGDAEVAIKREKLGDGRSIWTLRSSSGAGGGTANIWSSPDGKAVLVTTHSD
jgi:hypothetical protein